MIKNMEALGKEIEDNMKKRDKYKKQKVINTSIITNKTLEYFKTRDTTNEGWFGQLRAYHQSWTGLQLGFLDEGNVDFILEIHLQLMETTPIASTIPCCQLRTHSLRQCGHDPFQQ
jgi:hypothetical protein